MEDTFARLFALADADEQARVLNKAGLMWNQIMENVHGDIQASRIAEKLDSHGRELIKKIAGFIEVQEATKS